MRYNRIGEDLDIAEDILKENLIFSEDKVGDVMSISMKKKDSANFFGVTPPDLSVIARSRGPDWLYTYLHTFYIDESRPFGVNNLTYKDTAMPHVLWELQGFQQLVNTGKRGAVYYKPTYNVHIQYNEGFKKCDKYYNNNKKISKTYQDLTHAYITAFNDAKKNGYKHILILEEDFIFSNEIRKQRHIDNINAFLPKMKKNKYILSLGCAPVITIKHSQCIRKCFLSLGTHAMIYPDTLYNDIINDSNTIDDIDIYFNTKKKYMYYKPLAYQVYNETENRANWGEQFGYLAKLISAFVTTVVLSFLNMDKKEEPGTSILYKTNVYIYDFLLPILFALLILHIINRMYS